MGRPRFSRALAPLSILVVALLTLWLYMQCSFFLGQPIDLEHGMVAASHILRAQPALWYASFFSALTFGLSLYGFGHLLSAPTGLARTPGRSLARIQAQGLLVLGLWTYAQTYRLMVMSNMVAPTAASATPPMQRLFVGEPYPPGFAPPVLLLALAAGLAAGVAALQVWSILSAFRGSRRALACVIGALLLFGLGIPLAGLLNKVPSAHLDEILALPDTSEEVRALLLEDSEAAQRAVTTYMATHSAAGTQLSQRELRHHHPDEDWRCGLCVLPWTRLLAPTGLHLKLSGSAPGDLRPGLVIEVPRGSKIARIYPSEAAPTLRTVALSEAAGAVSGTDWVVLKVDVSVPMVAVRTLLLELRARGAKRVTLGATPHAGGTPRRNEPLLVFDGPPETPRYSHGLIGVASLRLESDAACPHVSELTMLDAMQRSPRRAPLPSITAFEFRSDATYGDFFAHFQTVFENPGLETVVLRAAR